MSTKIDPEKYYTLSDLVSKNMFPWCGTDIRRYRRFVTADLENKNHLKPVIIGEGRMRRYQFKGNNIINFIKRVEEGAIRL